MTRPLFRSRAASRAVLIALLAAMQAGCGTWQHNAAPAQSLAAPRVVERDLGADSAVSQHNAKATR